MILLRRVTASLMDAFAFLTLFSSLIFGLMFLGFNHLAAKLRTIHD